MQNSEESFQNDLLNMPVIGEENFAPAATQSTDTKQPSKTEALTKRQKSNFYGRWVEDGRFFGEVPEAIAASQYSSGNTDFDTQVFAMIDKVSGLVIATVLHYVFRTKYVFKNSLNPLYRTFKTLATAGIELGLIFYNLRMLPMILSTAIFSLALGALALPYWIYRQYFSKTPDDKRNRYSRVGPEGWSKYGKTFLVFGMYVGEVIGNVVSFVARGDFLRNIAIYGAIGSFVAFIGGLIVVPLINRFFKDRLISDKDIFRNNYVRSGITLGVAIGSIIGFVIGTFAFPGLGSLAGMAMGAAFASVIGGVTLGVFGKNITTLLQRKWKVKNNTDNSWDYATRNLSYLFGFIGAAAGFFIPVPGGAAVGAAIGSAVGSAVGWMAGFFVIRAARKAAPLEESPVVLPWSQRIANGTMVGSMIGATIGFLLGLAGGIPGGVMGATLGFSIGATLGGIGYGLYDKKARHIIKHFFLRTTVPVQVKPGDSDNPDMTATPAVTETPAVTPDRTITTTPALTAPNTATNDAVVAPKTSSPLITTLLAQTLAPRPRLVVRRNKPELSIDTSFADQADNEQGTTQKIVRNSENDNVVLSPYSSFFKPAQSPCFRAEPEILQAIQLKA